jgi:hypothetical protein
MQDRCNAQHCCELQHRSAPSYNVTFVALFPAIDVSRTPDNAAIATELRELQEHHPQHFPSNFRPTSIGFPSDCPTSLAVLTTSLLTSLLHHYIDVLRLVVLRIDVLRPTVLHIVVPTSCVLPYYSHVSCVLRTMVVHWVVLCPAAYLGAF